MPSETTVPPSIDEGARHRYEVARRQGHPAPLEQFLPDEGDPVFLATLEELVHLELQFAWQQRGSPGADTAPADRPPPVEAYVSRFPRLDQPHIVLRLLRREYLVRRRSGEPAAFDDYRKRFPELVHTSEDLEPAEHQADGDAAAGVFAGARLGRYQVCAEHARGGFGFVWRAIDDHLGREVALKGLKDPWASESTHRQRFLAEARIAARLEHPGVVPVYDLIGREGEPPYYTMKLVRGQTFAAAIRRFHNEPRPEGEQAVEQLRLLNSFLAVARTMAYAHSRRIIHRDLKPANVVLGDYGETIVLDWGLAKDLDRDDASTQPDGSVQPALDPGVTRPGTVMGTPLYMSPEQAAGHTDQVDERSDIYALGAILYQVLTGRRPFEGKSSEQVLADVIHTEPPPPRSLKPAIPRALEAICLRAMAKKPEARYAAVTDLTRDLERYLADEPVSAYAEPWHHRAGRWIRRHRSRVAMACGAVLLLGVVAVAWRTVVRVQDQRDEQTAARQREAQQMATSAEELARTRLHGAVSHRDFAEAERILDRARSTLADWPELSDLHARLDAMRGRAYRLSEFYRLADEAWRGNYDELDEESAAACETALGHVGVLENEEWWLRLPGDDLLPQQQAQLQHDVHGILLLYAGEVAKEGLSHYQEGSRPDIFTRSLALCRRAQRFQPTHSGSLLEVFCAIGTGELSPAKLLLGMPPLPAAEATTPVDLHFMGVGHYFLAELPEIPLSAFLRLLCRVRGSGMDGDTPWETSQRLLVEVTRREPRRFWGYVWLGHSLLSERYGDPLAAEAAFSAAIALRADQPHDDLGLTAGYLGRAVAILHQWRLADAARTAELLARIEADLDQAKELAPYDGNVRLRRARMYSTLARAAKTEEVSAAWAQRTVDEYAVWVEQARPIASLKDHASLPVVATIWLYARTDIAEMKVRAPSLANRADAITALISFRLGQLDPDVMQKLKLTEPFFEQAVEAANRVPRNNRDHLRARTALAGVWLSQAQTDPAPGTRQAKLAQALAAFEAVLGKQPDNYLAALGRVKALQLQGQDEPALGRLQAFANRADGQASQSMLAPWQRLEMHLEEARLQHRLGRVDEASRALEPARRLNAVAVHRLEQELWPAK